MPSSGHKLIAPPEASIASAIERAGLADAFLNLRNKPHGEVNSIRPFRVIGAVASDQQFMPLSVGSAFDAIVHVRDTTSAVPLD